MRSKRGFTLIELLIVISIIGILAAITLIGLRTIRYRALDVQRKEDIVGLARALESYTSENNEKYPISKDSNGNVGLECLNYDKNDLTEYSKTSPTGKILVESGHISAIPKPKNGGCYYYLHSSSDKGYTLYIGSSDGKQVIASDSGGSVYNPPTNPSDPNDPFYLSTPRRFDGYSDWGSFGESVSRLGDQDGDGYDEILVGAPNDDVPGKPGAGSVSVFSSRSGHLLKKLDGNSTNGGFGQSVAAIGDQNGDGLDDMIIGEPRLGSGTVYVFSLGDSNPLMTYHGETSNSMFGQSVCSIGDVNNDGKDEFAVGAFLRGVAYIFTTQNSNFIKKFSGTLYFGSTVASISDQDNDGRKDLLISSPMENDGARTEAGAIYIYSSFNLGVPIRIIRGTAAFDHFGQYISPISDQDGDAKDEIAASSQRSTSKPGVLVHYSTTSYNTNSSITSDEPFSLFGYSLSRLGDQNNDGKEELVIAEYDQNLVYIYSYNGTAWSVYRSLNIPSGSASFGNSVAPVNDLNHNDTQDLIVSDLGFTVSPGQHQGSVYIVPLGN